MLLLTIVSFLMRKSFNDLLYKFDKLDNSINKLDKTIAVVTTKQEHHNDRFKQIEHFEERIDKELKDVRTRLHELGNTLNQIVSRFELHESKCAERAKQR